MSEPTVSALVVRALMELAVSRGAAREMLAARSGIDPLKLSDPDHRVPLARYKALMRAGQDLCRDPALALHFGEAVPVSEISIGVMAAGYAETSAERLALMNRYAPLTIDFGGDGTEERFQLVPSGAEIWLIDVRKNPNDFPELTESTFARIACWSGPFLGDQPFLRGVHVTHEAPAYRAEYDRIFKVPVIFESDKNAMFGDAAAIKQLSRFSSRSVSGALSAHAEVLLEKMKSSKSTRGRVETVLTPMLEAGDASIETVASRLGFSRQTLFRRLKAEGVTYEKVLDELRHKLALHYLGDAKLSVNETAYRVGFSEPAAFSRAFKRWTGSSPRTLRR
jgi:AraC-like DNA-binding protein